MTCYTCETCLREWEDENLSSSFVLCVSSCAECKPLSDEQFLEWAQRQIFELRSTRDVGLSEADWLRGVQWFLLDVLKRISSTPCYAKHDAAVRALARMTQEIKTITWSPPPISAGIIDTSPPPPPPPPPPLAFWIPQKRR